MLLQTSTRIIMLILLVGITDTDNVLAVTLIILKSPIYVTIFVQQDTIQIMTITFVQPVIQPVSIVQTQLLILVQHAILPSES